MRIIIKLGEEVKLETQRQGLLPRQRTSETLIEKTKIDEKGLKKIIRDMNLKVTDQRLLILSCLVEGISHVTAQELFELVSQKDSSIGFATVYRFLRTLTESKFVTEVRMGGLPARYEFALGVHHDHLTCDKCGRICEFENPAIEALQLKVAEHFGFKLTSHLLELYGICPDCQ